MNDNETQWVTSTVHDADVVASVIAYAVRSDDAIATLRDNARAHRISMPDVAEILITWRSPSLRQGCE